MDAREQLRRYLEQRRDAGERELTLDSITVEQALQMLGAPQGLGARRRGPSPQDRDAGEHVWGQSSASAPAPEPEGTADPAAASPTSPTSPASPVASADWRTAIRDAGGAPAVPPEVSSQRPSTSPVVPRVSEQRAAPVPGHDSPSAGGDGLASIADVPAGLTVGGASRAGAAHPAFALASLAEVAATVATCTRCPLFASATNPVPGAGNPDADFMIVGEAPGANEDAQGVPFVGQAGQLLTKIIGAIQLGRDDVFIANVLKHRPPGNRNPTAEEVMACSPYLVRQIELVRPKVILALGTFAAQTLLETKLTIGKLRGQVHRYYGVPLIVTYHPAALLRNPAWKRPTWEDVQLARRILDLPQSAEP